MGRDEKKEARLLLVAAEMRIFAAALYTEAHAHARMA